MLYLSKTSPKISTLIGGKIQQQPQIEKIDHKGEIVRLV